MAKGGRRYECVVEMSEESAWWSGKMRVKWCGATQHNTIDYNTSLYTRAIAGCGSNGRVCTLDHVIMAQLSVAAPTVDAEEDRVSVHVAVVVPCPVDHARRSAWQRVREVQRARQYLRVPAPPRRRSVASGHTRRHER